jgi:hypothetical protein
VAVVVFAFSASLQDQDGYMCSLYPPGYESMVPNRLKDGWNLEPVAVMKEKILFLTEIKSWSSIS